MSLISALISHLGAETLLPSIESLALEALVHEGAVATARATTIPTAALASLCQRTKRDLPAALAARDALSAAFIALVDVVAPKV